MLLIASIQVFIRVAKHEEDTHERLSIKNTADEIKESRKVSLEAIEEEDESLGI